LTADFGNGARPAGPTSEYIEWFDAATSLFLDSGFILSDRDTPNRIRLLAVTESLWAADGLQGWNICENGVAVTDLLDPDHPFAIGALSAGRRWHSVGGAWLCPPCRSRR